MTGAAIVRWETGGTVVLAVHGAFDGASAWALRLEMEASHPGEFEVDLTHAIEACDFAASLFASWTRGWGRSRRVRFRPGAPEHARVLAGHGLELVAGDAEADGTADAALAIVPIGPPVTGASA